MIAPAGSPWLFLRSAAPWRSLAYLAGGAVSGLVCLVAMMLLGGLGVLLSPVLVGLVLLGTLCLAGVGYGAWERWRLRLVGARALPDPHRAPDRAGLRAWVGTRLREPVTWRELGYLALSGTVLWPVELVLVIAPLLLVCSCLAGPLLVVVLPAAGVPSGTEALETGWLWLAPAFGLLLAAGSAWLWAVAARARARLAEVLLAAPGVTEDAFVEVTRSRTRLVDRFERERDRIERDLHDGVQRRLLGVSMHLGLARSRREGAPPELVAHVDRAFEEAMGALEELRDLVDGIHPRILDDRGLRAAVHELAAGSLLPAHTDLEFAERFPPGVEACAYYTVSEALINAGKHSGATEVQVGGGFDGCELRIEIRDDGRGGAGPQPGGGLEGLADRAAAVGGILAVASPEGGPTVLRLTVPCRPLGG